MAANVAATVEHLDIFADADLLKVQKNLKAEESEGWLRAPRPRRTTDAATDIELLLDCALNPVKHTGLYQG